MASVVIGVTATVGNSLGPNGEGVETLLRSSKERALVVATSSGIYAEDSSRAQIFNSANQAAQAVSVALATTYTGFLLSNPVNSGWDLIPLLMGFALSVAPVAPAPIGLIQGFSATGGVTVGTTPLVSSNNYIGSAGGIGKTFSAATIVTPTWLAPAMQGGFTAGAFPSTTPFFDLNGAITIPPGGFIAIGALTAVTGLGFMFWKEVRKPT